MHRPRIALLLGGVAALVVAAAAPITAAPAKPPSDAKDSSKDASKDTQKDAPKDVAKDPRKAKHDRIVAFWTPDRVAQAQPRDKASDLPPVPAKGPGKADKAGKGGKGGKGGSDIVTGASWKKGGDVVATTGKVLFELGGSYWLCSAGVVDDGIPGRSFVLTAAHCAVDETTGAFATNWMFVPDYDSAPAPLTLDGSFCDFTKWGCWTADSIVVRHEFASAGSYNQAAIQHDAAIAVVLDGGKADAELDATVGHQAISTSAVAVDTVVTAFGYPVTKRTGADLVYCKGPIDTDPYMSDATYALPGCTMAVGSSGGPWFAGFDESTGRGTVVSVNSYGYRGVKAMYGPTFGAWTQSLLAEATTAATDTVVGP